MNYKHLIVYKILGFIIIYNDVATINNSPSSDNI